MDSKGKDVCGTPIHMGHVVVVVVYSYFLYCNKQTSAKTQWVFEVITPPPQCCFYISKIKSNSRSEVWCGDVWLRRNVTTLIGHGTLICWSSFVASRQTSCWWTQGGALWCSSEATLMEIGQIFQCLQLLRNLQLFPGCHSLDLLCVLPTLHSHSMCLALRSSPH